MFIMHNAYIYIISLIPGLMLFHEISYISGLDGIFSGIVSKFCMLYVRCLYIKLSVLIQ